MYHLGTVIMNQPRKVPISPLVRVKLKDQIELVDLIAKQWPEMLRPAGATDIVLTSGTKDARGNNILNPLGLLKVSLADEFPQYDEATREAIIDSLVEEAFGKANGRGWTQD
jgi:hypothetical protein